MTTLEILALLAVVAVMLGGLARTTLRKRERRRVPRELDPDYSPLQLYRAGAGRSYGTQPRPVVQPQRPVSPAPRPSAQTAAADPRLVDPAPRAAETAPRRQAPQPADMAIHTRQGDESPVPMPGGSSARPVPAAARPKASPPRPQSRPETKSQPISAPAADGTLQLLPGRLEVLSGLGQREEIRFVRVGNLEPDFTFGRSAGEPHLHVRLESPTVSRLHARMRRTDAGWLLSNLSGTNPVVVNGVAMTNGHEHHLVDGDRIEMGEVVFQFRAG